MAPLRVLLLLACASAASGCLSPRTAIGNLDELYGTRPGDAPRSGDRATYANEVTNRGFFSQASDAFHDVFSDEPRDRDVKELKDPVDFALENLAMLAQASAEGLDLLERARALAVTAEMGRIDPSRIVRARAYETTVRLWAKLPIATFRFEIRPLDEPAANAQLDALLALANAPVDRAAAVVETRAAELESGARALIALRPDRFSIAHKLLLLATKCGRLAERNRGSPELVALLESAALTHSGQVAFLAARPDLAAECGLADPSSDVRIGAGRVLVAVDPVAATVELGTMWIRTADPLVRVAWIQALGQAPIKAPGVHPTLRAPLGQELEDEDAAVAWWTRHTLAALLGLDGEKASVAEVRSKWLALGEWNENARS